MKRETRLVHTPGHELVPPLSRATTYDRAEGPYLYQRNASPTVEEAERLLGELEGGPGPALLFPSGMGAVTSVLLALLAPGARVAFPHDAYYGVAVLLQTELARWGLELVSFDQTGPAPDGVDVVWLETPSNPLLSFPDLDAHVEAAHAAGARVVVDSTAATPVLLRPLEHGADVVVHSATKYLSGHSDTLLGAAACAADRDRERIYEFRTRSGIVAAPDPAWLLLRGLRTLAVRVARQSASALELARRLDAHPAVERVFYPGLGDATAARYLDGGFGGLLSFLAAGGADAAARVEQRVRTIRNATSLGGVETLLETRHRYEGDRVPETLVRLAVGLEDVDDLWDDLAQALA
ncbi:MAG TPA: PLP-dependent aspartate aminotransferase family protein [Gaiellaceae bacterium]|nr:PLP-dependent aspartate aminotransferase family protein [Gaiellaceae bacterium]